MFLYKAYFFGALANTSPLIYSIFTGVLAFDFTVMALVKGITAAAL